jgi:hypothetical protein
MYQVAVSIVEEQDVSITQGVVARGREGRTYSVHGIGLPLVSVPIYAAARVAAGPLGVSGRLEEMAVASLMPIIVGLLAAALYGLARRLGGTHFSAVLIALGAVWGTYLLAYAKDFFSEPLAALCLVVGIGLALDERPVLSGLAVAAAAVTRPQLLAFFPVVLTLLWGAYGVRAAMRAGAVLAIGLALVFGYNYVRFASPTAFGYGSQGFTTPPLEGLAGLLFHPRKSILLFAPLVLILPFALPALRRAHPLAFWLLLSNLVLAFAISATWWAWGGGWVWGPRLLLPGVIPALAAVSPWMDRGGRWRRAIVGVLVAAGCAVSAPMVVVPHGAQASLAEEGEPIGVGPSIPGQYRLIAPIMGETRRSLAEPIRSRIDVDRYAALWQVAVIKERGRSGTVLAAAGTAILTVLAIGSGWYLLRGLATERAPDAA